MTTDPRQSEPVGALQRGLSLLRRALPWIAFVVFAYWGMGKLAPSATFQEGAELPQINAQLADGSQLTLQAARGQVLVLNFWASYCQPCRVEAPYLSDAQAHDVRVVGLSVEPFSTADVTSAARKIGFRFPVGVADEALLSRFRVQSVPTTYVIGKNGKIVLSRVGAIAKRELEAAIAAARDAT